MQRNVPLVDQVLHQIIAQIESGAIGRDGEPLPSEADLAKQFCVSRATVSNALDRLDLAGLIVRRRGVGTFVTRLASDNLSAVRGRLDQAGSFMDLLECSGREASCTVLATRIGPAEHLSKRLEIDPLAGVVTIEKLFRTAATPIIHCVNVVPLNLLKPACHDDACNLYERSDSTYAFLEACADLEVHHQESEVCAVLTGDRLSPILKCSSGAPLLRVDEVGYSADLVPLFYGINHFRGDLVSFLQTRGLTLSILNPLAS